MQNKKLLYILLPVVVVVWGLIIFKVVDALSDDEAPVLSHQPEVVATKQSGFTHELALNYPDPFLGKSKRSEPKKVTVKKKAPTRTKKKKEAPKVQAPKLRYNGRIENRESSDERHLIAVNGSAHIISLGEEVDGVKLEKVYADSVLFKWNNEKIYVRR